MQYDHQTGNWPGVPGGLIPVGRLNRPIAAHFHSGDFERLNFGEDLGEAI
jgi:hypothetical protein